MNLYGGQVNKLIEELEALPGIGSKSAQRLAFHLIGMPADKVERIANTMIEARRNVRYCSCCCTLTDKEICPVCANPNRDKARRTVGETPRERSADKETGRYS